MEALTAVGLASNIAGFVDFLSKLVSESNALYHSATGQTSRNVDLEAVAQSVLERKARIRQSLDAQGFGQSSRQLTTTESQELKLAEACANVAQQLVDALDGLKKKHRKGKWLSFRLALRHIWAEDKIKDLENRLSGLRQELMAVVLQTICEHQNATAGELKLLSRQFLSKLDDASRWQRDLVQAIHESHQYRQPYGTKVPEATTSSEQYISLDIFTEEQRKEWREKLSREFIDGERRIEKLKRGLLHQLRFIEIADREYGISRAHKKTMEWVYEDPPPGPRSWPSFSEWLKGDDNAVYWITGKPGSGKSTLVKFIGQHEKTREALAAWLPGLTLLSASFYFWNSGTDMQMSIDGLLRTLLYQCLEKIPMAIPEVFPERWNAMLLFEDDQSAWTWRELQNGLENLLKLHKEHRFVFFVDGLDECAGDHTKLVELLLGLLSETPNLKLCLASRPWVQFEEAFKAHPQLVVSNLTFPDICLYINDKLKANSGFLELEMRNQRYAARLMNSIATKSDGVFLWVKLVVQSLLHGLTGGDSIADLQRRLDTLPPDLNDLFRKILQSVEPSYREDASQIFQLVRAAKVPPSVSVLSHALSVVHDRTLVISPCANPQSKTELFGTYLYLKRRLNSRCKGLLEIMPSRNTRIMSTTDDGSQVSLSSTEALIPEGNTKAALCNGTIQFLHRTVRDFFAQQWVWDVIITINKLSTFRPQECLSEAFLLELKGLDLQSLWFEKSDPPTEFLDVLWENLSWCMEYACEVYEDTGQILTQVLNELHSQMTSIVSQTGPDGRALADRCDVKHWAATILSLLSPSFLQISTVYNFYWYSVSRSEAGPADHGLFPVFSIDGSTSHKGSRAFSALSGLDVRSVINLIERGERAELPRRPEDKRPPKAKTPCGTEESAPRTGLRRVRGNRNLAREAILDSSFGQLRTNAQNLVVPGRETRSKAVKMVVGAYAVKTSARTGRSRKTFLMPGWYNTGGVCTINSRGWLRVVGRTKELIKYKGFQISPTELESYLNSYPHVLEEGVGATWDESQLTELPTAWVVLRNHFHSYGDKVRALKEVHATIDSQVSGYKKLRGDVWQIETMPGNPTGKIVRKQLVTMRHGLNSLGQTAPIIKSRL